MSRITSDHYGARRAAPSDAPASPAGSLTPSADARLRGRIQGGVQFSQREPHRPGGDVSGAPLMRSDRYGGRALHAAPTPPPAAKSTGLDELFGSDDDLDAEIDALLDEDDD
jgi:hypothetical protein